MRTPKRSRVLADAIAARKDVSSGTRDRYNALVGKLAANPDDEAVLAEMARLGAMLAIVDPGLQALELALAKAVEAEAAEARTKAREASEGKVEEVFAAAAARSADADEADKTAAAHLAALAKLRTSTDTLMAGVREVATIRHGDYDRRSTTLAMLSSYVGCDAFAEPLGAIASRASALLDSGTLSKFMMTNSAVDHAATFAAANDRALKQIRSRL